jgi:mannose-6-phosphate isomerase-like protein (cupin superfamily)
MESKATHNSEAGLVRVTLGGATFEALEWPESTHDGSLISRVTFPPEAGKFLALLHRHYTRESNEILSGQAEVTHGYDEHLETVVLGPGDRILFGPHEWHGIRNLSDQEDLVTRQIQTPGDKWAHMARVAAEQMQQTGHLAPDFQKWYFEYIGIEFQRRAKREA